MLIASDIGGVIRDLATGARIRGSVKALRHFQQVLGHEIVLLSKCKPTYIALIQSWLIEQSLQDIPVHYCRTYEEKLLLGANLGVDCIIDDKVQVLQHFPSYVLKIWYCAEERRIQGLQAHDEKLFGSLHVCRIWADVVKVITDHTSKDNNETQTA